MQRPNGVRLAHTRRRALFAQGLHVRLIDEAFPSVDERSEVTPGIYSKSDGLRNDLLAHGDANVRRGVGRARSVPSHDPVAIDVGGLNERVDVQGCRHRIERKAGEHEREQAALEAAQPPGRAAQRYKPATAPVGAQHLIPDRLWGGRPADRHLARPRDERHIRGSAQPHGGGRRRHRPQLEQRGGRAHQGRPGREREADHPPNRSFEASAGAKRTARRWGAGRLDSPDRGVHAGDSKSPLSVL
jgi:hypothetical protein